MNYEFKEISLDNYELHYTNKDGEKKVIPFKRTVALAKKITKCRRKRKNEINGIYD